VTPLASARLPPGMKPVELVYYLHLRRPWRILAAPDRGIRRRLCHCAWPITVVSWYVRSTRASRVARAKPCDGESLAAGGAGSRTTGHHAVLLVADHSLVDAGDARLG
jgi:hypothetical protein